MSATPFFSILLSAYNAADTLARAVDSVLTQDFDSWELIIVNDGSIDATAQKAGECVQIDNRISLFTQTNQGCAAARATAQRQARGNYLMKLDADDELTDDALVALHTFIGQHPNYEIYSANALVEGDDGKSYPYFYQPRYSQVHSVTLDEMLTGCWIFSGAACISRAFAEKIGGFRAEARSEDYDLWLRALAAGAKHLYTPQYLYRYHIEATNRMNTTPTASYQSYADILEQLVKSDCLNPQQAESATSNAERFRQLAQKEPNRDKGLAQATQEQARKFTAWTQGHFSPRIASGIIRISYALRGLVKPFRLIRAHRNAKKL